MNNLSPFLFRTTAASFFCIGVLGAQAQFPITITDSCSGGIASFTQDVLPLRADDPLLPLADFGATRAGSCDDDIMFSHAMFWRVAGDQRLSQFYESGAPGEQGGLRKTRRGNTMQVDWPDVDSRGLVQAVWDATVTCCGREGGAVEHRWTFTNLDTAPLALEFYAFTDFDYGVNFANISDTGASGSQQIVRMDPGSIAPLCRGLADFSGEQVSAWEVGSFPQVETNLLSAAFVPLSSASLPFGPSDYTGALGWTRTVPVGQSISVLYRHGHNCLDCPTSGSITNYGVSSGGMSMSTADTPRVGCAIRLDVTGGVSNTQATLLIGGQTNVPLPGCPQTLLISPVLATLTAPINVNGDARFDLPRSSSIAFCGFALHFQAFAIDPAATCIPLIHSDGVRVVYGN